MLQSKTLTRFPFALRFAKAVRAPRVFWGLGVLLLLCGSAIFWKSTAHSEDTSEKRIEKYPNEFSDPSIIQLIAHPERYHGRKIFVKGFATVRFEGTGLYLSEIDAKHLIMKNGIELDFERKKIDCDKPWGPTKFHNKYVSVGGTFRMLRDGYHWNGRIEDIYRVSESIVARD